MPISYSKPTFVAGIDHKTNAGSSTALTAAVYQAIVDALKLTADAVDALNTDRGADRILFWDDSAGVVTALVHSAPLTITGTSLTVAAASETVVGVTELATAAEAVTGTSTSLAVHPAGLTATRGLYVGINAQTGTTYAPVLTDQGKLVTCTNAAAITVTLPSNATTAFPIGTQIDFAGMGAGKITFVAGSGATAVGTPSLVTRAQYSAVTAVKTATDAWLIIGDTA